MRRDITLHGGDFVATGDIIADAVGGKWDNPSGAFNIALKEKLTVLSVADNWQEAREEWKATGKVWYVPMKDDATEVLPEPHKSSHAHFCICGHPIAWHFEIENTENGRIEIVGSEHIGFWMIVRHMIENLGIDEDMVTQERVKEWITEAVKSMKAEWWWGQNGETFEEWFNVIKEQDLILNVRDGKSYYDDSTTRYENQIHIRKKSSGTFGTSDYQMASIVWRWNHPDNDKAQTKTRGYPNDRLWNDMMMFFFNIEKHNATIETKRLEREARILQVREHQREQAERRAREQEEYDARQAIRRAERVAAENERQVLLDTAFERACEEWDIVQFTAMDGRNEWEQSFLSQMINRINNLQHISEKQKNRVIKIVNRDDDTATEKQLSYIRKLGGEPDTNLTKAQASVMIDELKEE